MSRPFVAAIAAALITAAASGAAQTTVPATSRAHILELAREKPAADVWAAWTSLPNGPEKLRLGVEVATTLKDVPRAVELYDQWAMAQPAAAATETPLLREIALATAAELIAGRDVDTGVSACSAALRLSPTFAPCRRVLDQMAGRGQTLPEQALGAYALADAGLRPFPSVIATTESTLTPGARLQFATRFTHLPAADRVSLLRPLVGRDVDAATRYQAILSLGEIRSSAADGLIRNAEIDTTALRQAQTVALAEQGDQFSLDAVAKLLPSLDNYSKAPAAFALARVGDARGAVALDELLRSPVDLQRLVAATYVVRLNTQAGGVAVLTSLTQGSPAIRPLALQAAGPAHLGRNRAVFTRLAGAEPIVRAAAVGAVADTLTSRAPAGPAAAPPPLPEP